MAQVADRAVSSSKCELDERWLGCGGHQVDSILKRLIPRPGSTNQSALERINDPSLRCLFDEVEAVTTITRISKQSSIVLPSGFSLKAVADTRFHKLHDSLAEFSKSFNHVQSAFEEHGTPAGLDALRKIRVNSHEEPVLINFMVQIFHPFKDLIKHMQTTAAASIHTVIPMLIVYGTASFHFELILLACLGLTQWISRSPTPRTYFLLMHWLMFRHLTMEV
jgi:hypothetical protein